jgi:hypothetical protein
MAPGGVEPPPADSKFSPEPDRPRSTETVWLIRAVFGPVSASSISVYLGGSGGPIVAPMNRRMASYLPIEQREFEAGARS